MLNGTKPRERLTASGWSWVLLDSPSTDLSLSIPEKSEKGEGLPQRVDVDVKRIVRERGHWPTAEVVIEVCRLMPYKSLRVVAREAVSTVAV